MFPVIQLTSDSTREGFPSWSPDGSTIIYSFFNIIDGTPVMGSKKISSHGGTPVVFTDFATEHPQWSPDGHIIVFDGDTGASVFMINAEGGKPKTFLPESIKISKGALSCWSPNGLQIALKSGITSSLYVYDVKTGGVTNIYHEEGIVPLPGCWSRDNKWIFIARMDAKTRISTIWKISSDGKEKEQINGHHKDFYRYLALSPDGTLLVYAVMEKKRLGLWIMPAEGGKSLPVAISLQDHNECPSWSPDGKRLAFSSGRTGRGDIYIMEMDIEKVKAELELSNK